MTEDEINQKISIEVLKISLKFTWSCCREIPYEQDYNYSSDDEFDTTEECLKDAEKDGYQHYQDFEIENNVLRYCSNIALAWIVVEKIR